MAEQKKSVAIVGAGIFGLSLAIALNERNYKVTVFDQNRYDQDAYEPGDDRLQVASIDHNKIFRASYGTKEHYQRLAMESREVWISEDEKRKNAGDEEIFNGCGMLRVQPSDKLGALERETLVNMERNGLLDKQFVKSDMEDRKRARGMGWEAKLLDFQIPEDPQGKTYEAVLDSLAGFTKCSAACVYYQKTAAAKGVAFHVGHDEGAFDSLIEVDSTIETGKTKVTGLKTKSGATHVADVVVIAGK
ncbi:hypothetical protein NECHADRAFT_79853 [Paecilomyces variotii No. 5]|uniref:FAD dependent oxidoreductase domain-containing protein n=1 Tax=Byssochlamys spectabilis (strain No. 5 / NBRC 109023) TaxID=1356009 RepID=V5FX95_BYSSN|nr:hypothetical protein NECHADRAFT_79853 [Paecilomyces variotii No. 5]